MFSGKNRGVTPSVAAPGVIHPSDATASVAVRSHNISSPKTYIAWVNMTHSGRSRYYLYDWAFYAVSKKKISQNIVVTFSTKLGGF